jgi:hypothetical protein
MVGKTHADGSRTFGENAQYGTPNIPRRQWCLADHQAASRRRAAVRRFCARHRHRRSVRIPASFCGIYAIRLTTDGRWKAWSARRRLRYHWLATFARDGDSSARIGEALRRRPADAPPRHVCW